MHASKTLQLCFTDPEGLQLGFQYGNWGGQGWVNGEWRSETKNFPAQGKAGWKRPTDPRDWCYYWHDVCLHNAAGIKEAKCRRKTRKQCDIDLAKCLGKIRQTYGMQYGDTTIHEGIFWAVPNDHEDIYVSGLEQYSLPDSPWPTPIP